MPTLIADRPYEEALKRQRTASGADRFDEVWDGVYVMSPMADSEHQELATQLAAVLQTVVGWPGLGKVLAGVNVSDCAAGWTENYRIPDVAVFLNDTKARNLGTHWLGGPDLAIEITSPGDLTREKMPFYAAVGTRELLILDRESWTLELHTLNPGGKLVPAGVSEPASGALLRSQVVALSFRLEVGEPRPVLVVEQAGSEQRWRL